MLWIIYVIIIYALIKWILGSSRSIKQNIPARTYQEVMQSLPPLERPAYAHYHRESIKAMRKTRKYLDYSQFAFGFIFLFFSLGGFYITFSALMHPDPSEVDFMPMLGPIIMLSISTIILSVALYCFKDAMKDLKDIRNNEKDDLKKMKYSQW